MPAFPILLIAVFGAVGFAGGILLIVKAGRVSAPLLDLLGAWVTSAVRALGILLILVSGIFLLVGIANIVTAG